MYFHLYIDCLIVPHYAYLTPPAGTFTPTISTLTILTITTLLFFITENAGLYKGLKDLGELVSSYQTLRENEQRGAAIVNSIVSSARTCNLDKDIPDLPTESGNGFHYHLLFLFFYYMR